MKILYVATISDTINAFMIPHILMLLDEGYQVDIACNVQTEISSCLKNRGCKVFDITFKRSPLNKENYVAYKEFKRIVKDERYDLIHTHTPVSSAVVRLVCKGNKNLKIIYTAHGFHFYKGAPLINWLIYYPIERYLSKFTDVIITMNKEDFQRAKKSFRSTKVEYIPGIGLDTKKFAEIDVDRLKKRKELGIQEDASIILSIGELNRNKNHETVIKAVAQLENANVVYIICGVGDLENHLRNLISELGLEGNVLLLGHREDISEICKMSDIFVFPSFREGLPMALMEAMICGLPVICSNIRGNSDLIENGKGGYLLEPNNINEFAKSIEELISDNHMRIKMGKHNIKVVKKFDIENVKNKVSEISKIN